MVRDAISVGNSSYSQTALCEYEMTQQQLAEIVGVTRQTIVAIEKEKYSPSLEAAFKNAAAQSESFDWVFSYDASAK